MSKDDLLAPRYAPVKNYWDTHPLAPEIDAIAGGSFKRKEPPEIKGAGYVALSMEAALWAFYKSSSFEDGALLAANLGDDADTTAAIYGQLAGAFYGEPGIPEQWRKLLSMREFIESLADRIYSQRVKRGDE